MRRKLRICFVAILSIFLVACSTSSTNKKEENFLGIEADKRESRQYNGRGSFIVGGFDSSGFYTYKLEPGMIYGALGDMYFHPYGNGKSTVFKSEGSNKIGLAPLMTGIVSNGNWLYFMDLSYNQQVIRISKDTGEKEILVDPGIQSSSFVIMDEELFVYDMPRDRYPEQTEFTKVNKDPSRNEKFVVDASISSPIPYDGKLYFDKYDENVMSNIYSLDMKTHELNKVTDGSPVSIDDGYMTTFKLDIENYNDIDYDSVNTISSLYDLKQNKVIFTKQDEILGFIDTENRLIYSYQIRGEQIYRLYDFGGNVIAELKPDVSISVGEDTGFSFSHPFGKRDFGDIIVANKKEFLANVGDETSRIMKCSFETSECKLVP